MPIEIAQFTIDQETHEERYIRLRVLDTQPSLTYNTHCVTGVDEDLTVLATGDVIRKSGQTLRLAERGAPTTDAQNILTVGEVFLTGPSGRTLCVRRINYIVNGVNRDCYFDDDDYELSLRGLEWDGE